MGSTRKLFKRGTQSDNLYRLYLPTTGNDSYKNTEVDEDNKQYESDYSLFTFSNL